MLRSLKEVRADDSVVGFYQSTTMGAFYSQTIIDTQAIHQEKLRQGGVVVLHGIFFLVYKDVRFDNHSR
jgi:translation initiation factor 3 subunit H